MHQQNTTKNQLYPSTLQSSVTQMLRCTISLPCTQQFSPLYGETASSGQRGTVASTTTPREPLLLASAAGHHDTKLSITKTFLCTGDPMGGRVTAHRGRCPESPPAQSTSKAHGFLLVQAQGGQPRGSGCCTAVEMLCSVPSSCHSCMWPKNHLIPAPQCPFGNSGTALPLFRESGTRINS